jgi:hypothetical protein
MNPTEVTLPIGLAFGRQWYRNAGLRPVNGRDEEILRDAVGRLSPAERTTLLLSLCLIRLGPKTEIQADDVRSLTAGDRDALLLHLRRLTFGNKAMTTVSCPHEGCGERLDLDLAMDRLLVPPMEHAARDHQTTICGNGATYKVTFRLPTGADQEEAAHLALRNPKAASTQMLERCVRRIEKGKRALRVHGNLPQALLDELPKRMAELDPQAEILLTMTCPACEKGFIVNFDVTDYFFREWMSHSEQLYREVHLLALHYHWSEEEILSLSYAKRMKYLGLLAEALNP